jgi:Tol biopolymer transport system component
VTLAPGARLGPYEIVGKLGEGGMGLVFRARDFQLGREVALKVLPEAFTADPERTARFEREAKVLASLNHPNVAQIYGLETSGDTRALVMELVEGPTLAERLENGALPLDESLSIARQIAEALEEAHEKGIIHRDLKPQNVKASIEGKVKVLDFGLAKALDPVGGSSPSASQLARSPTLTLGATLQGVILGTAAYMSPEQAAGGVADRRSDVWSFGVVLYEMLAGRRLFDGETVSHVLAGVLKDEPDFTALPADVPPRILRLLRRCLRKRPRERLQAIGDARLVLEEQIAEPEVAPADPSLESRGARARRAPWILAAANAVAALAFAGLWIGGRGAREERSIHSALLAPSGTWLGDTFAISPDGSRLILEAHDDASGRASLWLRELATGEDRLLAATDGGQMPFWSPDGRQVGFFQEGKLRRLDLEGGSSQTICDAPTPRGGSWSEDGRIVFAASFRTGLSVVQSAGGTPQELTSLDESRGEKSHRFPVFLPGGEQILFLAQTAEGGTHDDASAIEALDLATGERTRLVTTNSSPLFADGDPARVLFWREGALHAQPFDPRRLRLLGAPVLVASDVAYDQNEEVKATVAGSGTLLYRTGSRGTLSSLSRIDRRGIDVNTVPIRAQELFSSGDFALSRDGKRLAYAMNRTGAGSTDLFVHDLERGTAQRLTFEAGSETNPAWSPDGRTLYYASDAENDGTIYRRAADGSSAPEKVGTTAQGIWPFAVAPNGKWILVGGLNSGTNDDLLRFDLGTQRVEPVIATPFVDRMGALSPDGALVAYASEESGRWEVYVQGLGPTRGRWQISTQGGFRPRWRGDGRELFFLGDPDRMMAVAVEPGEVPRFGAPVELFRRPIASFDVFPDGQQFVGQYFADSGDTPFTLITNWTSLLPER